MNPVEVGPPDYRAADLGAGVWSKYSAHHHRVTVHWAIFQLELSAIADVIRHATVHATRPPGAKHGPEYRRRLNRAQAGSAHVDLQKATRHLWLGDVNSRATPR